jgi:chromosome segregation ATPase
VVVDGDVWTGRAVDLPRGVSATAVLRAIRDEESAARVHVDCADPGAVHEHVARLPPRSFDRRGALAVLARERGHTATAQSALEDARAELAAASPPSVDVREARRRVAEAGSAEDRHRERVAELRGRVQARRETGADTTAVEAQLSEATRRLAEAETERIAAEQTLDRAESAARAARDRRERRLELEDRVGNLERAVRRELAASVWEAFRSAVEAVPGSATAGPVPGEFDGNAVAAALGITRLASLDAPVVVDGLDGFAGATEAAAVLDAPVVYTR